MAKSKNVGTIRGDVEKMLNKLVRITRNSESSMLMRGRDAYYRSTIKDLKRQILAKFD